MRQYFNNARKVFAIHIVMQSALKYSYELCRFTNNKECINRDNQFVWITKVKA
jgi:hypothetical protein